MGRKVVVTGVGSVNALGNNLAESWKKVAAALLGVLILGPNLYASIEIYNSATFRFHHIFSHFFEIKNESFQV